MKTRLSLLAILLLAGIAACAQELVVCSYNLRYKNSGDTDAGNGWNTRRTYLINLMNFQQPDLLGVQEALNAQMNDVQNGLKGYSYIGVGRDNGTTGGEYSAIFYRTERMVLLDHGDFWLSDTPYKASKGFPSKGGSTTYKRICTWGKFFDKATGSVIYHFNTHMDLDETNRQQSYYLIKQKIQEIASTLAPVIVSGDYNAVQTGEAYKLFYGSGFLYDCFHRAKQKFMTNGTCPGFNANNYSTVSSELRRIDHIFVSRAFNVEHYGVLNPCYYSTSGTADYKERAYSDHSPVIAKLTVRTPEAMEMPSAQPPVADGFYQLSTPEELQAFSFIVGGIGGFVQNTAAKAVLLCDIDMKGATSWLPIGSGSKPFTGTFDGQGHAIRNLAVKTGKSQSGLFGRTQGATIRNLHVDGTVTVSEGYSDHGVVGYADGTTIADVHSALTITTGKANDDTQHIGGIAGSLWGQSTVDRCSFSGRITDAGTNTVGGIAGYADGTPNLITNAINYGTVRTTGSETNTGGILGYVNYAGFRIANCANVGSVSGKVAYSGQLIGRQLKAMTAPPDNLYYLASGIPAFGAGTDAASATGATAVTAAQLASGEVCYRLNGDQTEINWYQTLPGADASAEADPYPVLDPTHLQVLLRDGVYVNDNASSMNEKLKMKNEKLKMKNEKFDVGIFNLAGQRLSKARKGINIVNGKKYILK